MDWHECRQVDNIWTAAPIDQLLSHLRHIADTLLPAPTHLLWLNCPQKRSDMAFSMENHIYIALYSAWTARNETSAREGWATECMGKLAHLSTGIQLANENLNHRTAKFVSDEHLRQLQIIRQARDSSHLFHAWHSRPQLAA